MNEPSAEAQVPTSEQRRAELQQATLEAARRKADAKYHGKIVVTPPAGQPIETGTRILVAIRKLEFGNLPDANKENEVSLVATAETAAGADAETPIVTSQFEMNHFRYVSDGQALNLKDLVIFSGELRDYLTIRCAIDEIEGTAFAEALPNLLPADAFPPYTLALGFMSALLLTNSDDQVLRLNHSLYSSEASVDDARTLKGGVYTFEKPAVEAGEIPQVKAEIEIIPISP